MLSKCNLNSVHNANSLLFLHSCYEILSHPSPKLRIEWVGKFLQSWAIWWRWNIWIYVSLRRLFHCNTYAIRIISTHDSFFVSYIVMWNVIGDYAVLTKIGNQTISSTIPSELGQLKKWKYTVFREFYEVRPFGKVKLIFLSSQNHFSHKTLFFWKWIFKRTMDWKVQCQLNLGIWTLPIYYGLVSGWNMCWI